MVKFLAILWGALLAFSILAPPALAQNLIPPDQSIGSVPGFAGTGLLGLYYDNANGYSSAAGSPPEASFTASNVCFPNCQGGAFDDGSGGLQAFINGNAVNINFFTSVEPVRLTWNSSEIDMSGYIAITTPGIYTFSAARDDNFSITIGGVTNSYGCCGTDTFQDQFTTPGLYRISMLFQESGGGSYMAFTGTDPNGNCILGCYDANNNLEPNDLFYSDTDLSGAPAPVIGGGLIPLGLTAIGFVTRRLRRNGWPRSLCKRRLQPGRSRSHAPTVPLARNRTFCTLPVGVLGSSSARISR